MGNRQWAIGNGQWAMDNGQWAMGEWVKTIYWNVYYYLLM
jgi:hypothetical protein